MDKIQRATKIHRSMTPHQMALYIVDIDEMCTRAAIRINDLLKERNATGIAIDNAIRGTLPDQHPMLSRLQMLANMAKRITELQDALELAEEAVRAKQPLAPEGWQLVPVEPTFDMQKSGSKFPIGDDDLNLIDMSFEEVRCVYKAMLAAAPKLGGERCPPPTASPQSSPRLSTCASAFRMLTAHRLAPQTKTGSGDCRSSYENWNQPARTISNEEVKAANS